LDATLDSNPSVYSVADYNSLPSAHSGTRLPQGFEIEFGALLGNDVKETRFERVVPFKTPENRLSASERGQKRARRSPNRLLPSRPYKEMGTQKSRGKLLFLKRVGVEACAFELYAAARARLLCFDLG
jgi:hypothetical protein